MGSQKLQITIPGNRLAQQYRSIQVSLDEAISRVTQRGVFTPSIEVAAFEEEFARYIGVRYAISVASGGTAGMLALRALGIKDGDEVISVPNVDVAASAPIAHAGGRAIWVDILPRTYNLDPDQLEAQITPKTRAIVAVHMYGNPAAMNRILEIAGRFEIPVVEDAALALGAVYCGQQVGAIGRIGCFSFAPGKILGALGKAGMVVTNDPDLAKEVRVLSTYGFDPSSLQAIQSGTAGARFEYLVEGFNASMDELQGAILRVKLKHLDHWLRGRRENARLYRKLLSVLEPEHLLLPEDTPGSEPVFRFFVVRSPKRDGLMKRLSDAGIWSGLAYVPLLHVQRVYQHLNYSIGSFPQAEKVSEELLCLPTVPELSLEEVETVSETVLQFFT